MFLRKNKFNEYRLSPLYDEEPAAVIRIYSTVMLSATDPVCAKSPQHHFVHNKAIGTARKTRQKSSEPFEHPITFRTDKAPSGAFLLSETGLNNAAYLAYWITLRARRISCIKLAMGTVLRYIAPIV